MRRKGILLLMITLLVGWAAVLHAQPKEVVFKLKPRGDCDEIADPADQPFDIELCVARCLGEWVSVCAYSEGEGGQIDSEGYTVAVEAWDPRVEFVEVELGRDVDDDQVNFFSPAIINTSGHTNVEGRQWLIANVIFETNGGFDTLAIPVGEASSIALIDFRIALGQSWGDDDSLESEVYLTDDAELNGFPQKNLVTEGGLSIFADIDSAQGSIRIPLHGPRIEIKSCEFVPRDRKNDPYQLQIEWELCGECPVYWWYRDRISGGCPDHGFTVYLDGDVYRFPDNQNRPDRCEYFDFPPPNPACQTDPPCPNTGPDVIRCDDRPCRTFTATIEFPNANAANGYHKVKVCAEFRATCEDCGDPCPQNPSNARPPCPPKPLPPEGTICSNECVTYVPVIRCECRTCTGDENDPDACQDQTTGSGPYWCLANPRYMLGDGNGNLFVGDTTVRDFDMLLPPFISDPTAATNFRENGPKIAFQFRSSSNPGAGELCVVEETLVCLDWRGQEILYFDPDWRPNNNAGTGPPMTNAPCDVSGGPAPNRPREVDVHIVVLEDGDIVNISEGTCSYIWGWKRGDANLDQVVNILDVVDLLNGIFMRNSDEPTNVHYLSCHRSANVNGGQGRGEDDDIVNISDAIYLLHFLLLAGGEPLFPFHTDAFHPDGWGLQSGSTPLKACEDPWDKGSSPRVKCPFCTTRASCTVR